MFTQIEISLLVRLVIAHLLTDFVFQSDKWVQLRRKDGWYSKHLYLHGAIAGVLAYLFSGLWGVLWLPAAVAATHILIDGIKARYQNDLKSFFADQFGHFAVLLVIWILVIAPDTEDIAALGQFFLPGTKFWVIAAAYLIIIWPSGVLINRITEKWRKDISEKEGAEKDKSLEKAGTWVGWLERFLILTFILLQQYAAIGFLVAAKSIFRFSESRKVGEYVLIGTLLSFVIAVIVGLVAGVLMGI
ncbi:MAG: DUF3307 domain-containing protein [Candidatus Methanoperedens sp.]|nr:DUF3307 domain-containing protein [Candidatus Methanoperedens sp.]